MLFRYILISFITFTVIHTLLVEFLDQKTFHPIGLNNENISKAERFLFEFTDDMESRTVVVGSSTSAQLPLYLKKDYINLSFHGRTALDGLKIIKESGKFPSKIIIEGTVLSRQVDDDWIASLFNTKNYYLKKYVKNKRVEYNPIGIFVGFIKSQLGYNQPPKKVELDNRFALSKTIEKWNLNQQMPVIEANLLLLEDLITFFQNNKVEVEMILLPVDWEVTQTKHYTKALSFYHDYLEITPRRIQLEDFQTSDGIHLLPYDLLQAAQQLFNL